MWPKASRRTSRAVSSGSWGTAIGDEESAATRLWSGPGVAANDLIRARGNIRKFGQHHAALRSVAASHISAQFAMGAAKRQSPRKNVLRNTR